MKTYVKYSLIAWLVFTGLVIWASTIFADLHSGVLRTLSFILPQMILFYLNLQWLSCRYLEKNKKKTYIFLMGVLVVIHVLIFVPIDFYLDANYPLDLPHFKDRPEFIVWTSRFFSSVPPLVISALLWKSLQLQKEREESIELQHQVAASEAKALKAQINPHFLFNSLNNIYSLAQMKSDKTGDAILSLSEILRFVTYESEKDKVSLHEELKQIENFIHLQKLKDDDFSNVEVHINDTKEDHQIAPMLLLPFIENSFKHSNFEDKQKGWIKITIEVYQKELIMDLSNSASLTAKVKKDGTGGVGMENVKKRLALIYPDKHTLGIIQDDKSYNVKLKLDLSE